jgi:hypothetical protein
VFVGKAVKNGLEDPNPRDNIMIGGIRFDVEKSWKGVSDDRVDLYGQSESYYGPPPRRGGRSWKIAAPSPLRWARPTLCTRRAEKAMAFWPLTSAEELVF